MENIILESTKKNNTLKYVMSSKNSLISLGLLTSTDMGCDDAIESN